ncbi:hypothetical protein C6P45_003932 [Maudiozyma exigua]|uniref:Uncharacterized protein n=1 Tax=Maudiozyma exigua TaxID=34358 RepID=A0A9P6WDE9_MAUEX|nr:hypothetical protein C6P45_003932 [Kazachstania exigua]
MSNYNRKIDVSVEQIRAIYGQLLESLQEHANESLPELSNNDQQKKELQIYIQEYLLNVMEMSSGSLNVVNLNENENNYNNNEMTNIINDQQQKYVEKFDIELNEKVRQRYQEWEDLTVKVSQLRRDGPEKINEMYQLESKDMIKDIDERINKQLNQIESQSNDNTTTKTALSDTILNETIISEYQNILTDLYTTKEQLPDTRATITKLKTLLTFLQQDQRS